MYEEGCVKVALEYMDMGSLNDIIKKAKKFNQDWDAKDITKTCLIPENIMAKMV